MTRCLARDGQWVVADAGGDDDAAEELETKKIFQRDRLVAWCIVPFDALKRTPSQRAEMVDKLGMARVAYDWRAEHVTNLRRGNPTV